jgi:SAM-dependent methyltransferase
VDIPDAARGFDLAAGDYERGRPGYPPEAVDHLVRVLRIDRTSTVVDLAAGTGKFTRLLVPTGARVIAVEPVDGMRDELSTAVPGVELLAGTAESLPLPDASAEAVTVAQAFHWFRGHEALPEIHRVLRSHGRLGIVWNRRDMTDPVQAALHAIIDPHRGSSPAHWSGTWRRAFSELPLFTDLQTDEFRMSHQLDGDGVVARVLSTSFMALLPPAERARVEHEVRALVAEHGETVALPYVTECHWCEAR